MNHPPNHIPPEPPPTDPSGVQPRLQPPPLIAVLAIVAVSSLGTGAIMNGIFFLARKQHGFNEQQNLYLGLVLGLTYILGAIGTGPLLRRLTVVTRIRPRAVLVWIHLAMGLLCFLPQVASGPWGIWVFAFTYSPLTGALWPIVESYLSGGRRGKTLRHAVGAFNLVWATAVIASYWTMSLVLGENPPGWLQSVGLAGSPLIIVSALGVIHILTIGFVLKLSSEPAGHVDDEYEPHPTVYVDLLRATRWLLVLSYILVCALNPILPTRLESIGADAESGARIASTWAVSRLAVFLLMQRWHGWHGRWRTTIWTGGALAFGFALTVLASSVSMMIIGLTIFGIGIGGVYCAALYYAMEVGGAQIEAGGKHEALIGLGYTAGPFIGLVPWWAHNAGLLETNRIAQVIVALAILAGGITLIGALWPKRTTVRHRVQHGQRS